MEDNNNCTSSYIRIGDAVSRRPEGDMRVGHNNYNLSCAVNHINGPCPGYPYPNDPNDTAPFDTAAFLDYLAARDNEYIDPQLRHLKGLE